MQPDHIDIAASALLLDIDGTLIDIAPRPHEAAVPNELRDLLQRLDALSGGAVALVSGRPIRDIDALFEPLVLSTIGGHGAEIRVNGTAKQQVVPPLDAALRARVRALAGGGIIVEDKGYSIAVHFRLAPEKEAEVQAALAAECAALPPDTVEMLGGKAMIEIKEPGVNKGTGVRALMALAPFAGRRPIFIGDDVTDEDAAAVMPDFGGIAISVGRDIAGASKLFETPDEVRSWLAGIAGERAP